MLAFLWRKLIPSMFRLSKRKPYRKPRAGDWGRRSVLQVEALETRLTPATYNWNGANTLALTLGAGESVVVSVSGGTTTLNLSPAGTWTATGTVTDGMNTGTTLTFTALADYSTSFSITNTGAAGTNNVSFISGTVTSASITLQPDSGSAVAAITESGTGALSSSGTLTTSTNNGTTLGGANTVAKFNAADFSGTGITLTNTTATLTITGITQTGTASINVTNNGNLSTSGAITALSDATSLTATGGALTIGAGIDTSSTGGSVTLSSTGSANDLTINGTIKSKNAVSATSDGNVNIIKNVTGSSASFTADHTGVGGKSISFPLASTIAADSQTYRAGNGSGNSTVSFGGGTFKNTLGNATPTTFIYKQAGLINDTEPANTQYFGNTPPTNLTIQSTNSSVVISTAANVAGSNLTLTASGNLLINNSISTASLTASGTQVNFANGVTTTTTSGSQSYTGAVQLNGGGIVTLDASATAAGSVTITGTVTNTSAIAGTVVIKGGSTASSSISGIISDGTSTTSLTLNGGSLSLGAASTYSDNTTLTSGTLILGSSSTGTTSGPVGIGTLVLNGGTLEASGAQSISNAFTVGGGATIDGSAGDDLTLTGDGTLNSTLTVNNGGATTFSGALGGTGGLTTNAGGIVTLSGTTANTYAGTTLVISGIMHLSKSANVAAIAGNLTIDNATTVLQTNNNQINNATTALTLTDPSATGPSVFDLGGFSATVGTLTGAGIVTDDAASGTGTLTVAGTGSTFAGTIQNGATATTSLTVNLTSGTFDLSGATLNIQDFTLTAGTVMAPGTGRTFDVSGNFAINGGTFNADSGSVDFTSSTNMQTLDSGGQSFANLTHSGAGVLQLANNGLTVTASFNNNAGSFDLNGQNWTMTGATFSNPGNVQLEGFETITGLTQDIAQGTWIYVGDNTGNTYSIENFGTTSYFALIIQDLNGTPDTYQATADLGIASFFYVSGGTYDANGHATTVAQLTKVDGGTYLASTAAQSLNGGLTVSDTRSPGSFTGGTGTVSVSNVNLSGGTLTAPSATMNVSGNFAIAVGTFTANDGTVDFTGAATQTLDSGGQSFHNLTHSGTGILQLVNNSLTVGGNLTNAVGAGNFDGLTNDMSVTVSGSASLSGGNFQAATLSVGGTTFINTAQVTTTGTQTYTGAVTLGTSTMLRATTATFNGNLTLGPTTTTATDTLTIAGNFALNANGTTTLTSTFAGTSATQFGHVVATGFVDLGGGTLALTYSGFTPAPGDTFDVIDSDPPISSPFSNVPAPGPDLINGIQYLATYSGGGGNALVLTVTSPVATISGVVYFDLNNNGALDSGEPGLADRTVYLDLNNNGVLDPGEPTAVTDANGVYVLRNVANGTYFLRQAPSSIVIQTTPAAGFTITVAGSDQNGLNFGDILFQPAAPVQATPDLYGPGANPDANTAYVRGLYHSILGRDADPDGLAHWTSLLAAGVSRQVVTQSIYTSAEHRGQQVDVYYQTYLHRAADAGGRQIWVNAFLAGQDETAVVTGILSSAEFQSAHPGDDAFVRELYLDILGRSAADTELSGWEQALAAGTSRAQVIDLFVHSDEAVRLAFGGFYSTDLHRAVDSGAEPEIDQLRNGSLTFGQATVIILSDPVANEFFNNAAATVA